MESRAFDPEFDYELVCDWWRARRLQPPLLEMLPDCGIVITDEEGVELLAVWLYFDTTTAVCLTAFVVTRPKLKLAETVAAHRAAWAAITERAQNEGAKYLRFYAPAAFGRYLVKEGFQADKRPLMNFSMELKPEEDLLCHFRL